MKSYESFEVNLLGKDCFDRFKDYIRNIVYEVTYVLLKYHSTSTHIESLLLIFQYLQMLSYTFHNEVRIKIFNLVYSSLEICRDIDTDLKLLSLLPNHRVLPQ